MNRSIGTIVQKDAAKNVYTLQATTDDIDRQGERVLPSGVSNLPHFLKYGSILYGHNWSGLPIAKPVGGRVSDKVLLLDIVFAETPMGQEVKYLFDEGFLSSFSIGFLPEMDKVDIIDGVRTYKSWELLEVSAVPVPANASATILRDAASRRGAPLAAVAKAMSAQDDARGEGGMPQGAASESASQSAGVSVRVDIADHYLSTRRA